MDNQPLEPLAYAGPKPPPLPSTPLPPILSRSETIAAPPVLETYSELEQAILDGGRYVVFQYCISILILSFKRSSGVIYVPPGQDAAKDAISNSLMSLLAGWWGIPWGPIWTISTVYKNCYGGTDLTYPLLAEKVGATRAAAILSRRRNIEPQGNALKMFRWALMSLLILLVMLPLILLVAKPARTSSPRPTSPGEAEFQSANRLINVNRGTVGAGNSPQAAAVAEHFSFNMKKMRGLLFEGGSPNGLSVSGHEFLTYCELRESQCVILVHVPELRRFSEEAKESLATLAWDTAQAALRAKGEAQPEMKLAVGLRGITLYDRVLMGNVVTNLDNPAFGLESVLKSARSQEALHPYFTPTQLQGSGIPE